MSAPWKHRRPMCRAIKVGWLHLTRGVMTRLMMELLPVVGWLLGLPNVDVSSRVDLNIRVLFCLVHLL